MMRRSTVLLGGLAGVLCLAAAIPALAQYTTTGAVFGTVTEPGGKPLPGVMVALKSSLPANPLVTTSDSNGAYRFGDIIPGEYTLSADLSGFVTTQLEEVTVRVGSSLRVDIQMAQAGAVKEQVAVTALVPQIEATKSQVNKYVGFNEIQNLPLQNRQFLDVLRTVPGVSTGVPTGTYRDRGPRNSFSIHGSRTNQNDFLLDGASNNDKSDLNYEDIASVQILGGPRSGIAGLAGQTFQVGTALQTYNLDAVQEVQVSTSMFSAEYGSGGSGGVINVITRNGTNILQGSVTVQEQQDAWVEGSESQDIKRDIAAVSIGGPFVKDKTHFFASYEWDDQRLGYDFSQRDYYVPAYLDNMDLTANHTKRDRFTFKLNQIFSASNNLSFTANYINERADVLQTIFRERSIDDAVPEQYENKSLGLIVRDLAVLGGSQTFILESVINATSVDRNFNSSNDNWREIFSTYVPEYSSYTIGMNSPDATNSISTLGWSEKLSWSTSSMFNKAGISVDYFDQSSKQVDYVSLYYYDYGDPATNPPPGFLRIPPTNLEASVTEVSAFGQTDWYVSPKATLNLGVRFGYDNLVEEFTYEPRIGVAYDLKGDGHQIIRAGVGLYHDRSNLIGVTGELRPPVEFGDYINDELIPSGLPGLVQVDPNLKLPTIYKAVLGYERQIGPRSSAGITLFANWNRDLFYTDYLNREDREGNRQDPTKGGISYYSNFGESDVYDAELEIRHTFSNGSMLQASYTYQHTEGNSSFDFIAGNDDIGRAVYKEGQISTYQVWGPLAYDQKHTLKFSGVFMLPWGFQASAFAQWNTGQPYFWYTSWYELPDYWPHFDFYGGGFNSQRLDDYFSLDLRLAWSVKISSTQLLIFLDGFNVTNHENVIQRNGLYAYNYGAPIGEPGTVYYGNWKRPTYGPKRSAQLGFRFSF